MTKEKIDILREGIDWERNKMHLQSTKGHNLNLKYQPSQELATVNLGKVIKLQTLDFPGIKPKLLVSKGDIVQKGQPVNFDKKNPIKLRKFFKKSKYGYHFWISIYFSRFGI